MNIAQFFKNKAEKYPDKSFVIQEVDAKITQTLTYKEFYEQVQIAAVNLIREGLRKDDRVAIVLGNSPETLIMWFAVSGVGGVAAVLESVLTKEELDKQLEHLEPKFVINESNINIFLGTDHGCRVSVYPSKPDDWAGIVYSSGTTGAPKGVMQTHNNYIMTGEAFAYWFNLKEDDRLYTCLSPAHINLQAYSTMGAIACGGTLILGSKFNHGKDFWHKIVATSATHINMIGGMLRDLHKASGCSEMRMHKVKTIANGQAIANEHLHRYYEQIFNAEVVVTYGSSENTFGFIMPLGTDKKGGNYVGKRKLHPAIQESEFQFKILAEDGAVVSEAGKVGELLLKNPYKTCYFKNDELTAERWNDGWYHTGDNFIFDKDGFAIFVGRKDDIIRKGGNLINPAEIENILADHPAIKEVAVLGIKDETGEPVIKAWIVVKDGLKDLDANNLTEYSKRQLASYKIPQIWEFVAELPKTATGRVQKNLLK